MEVLFSENVGVEIFWPSVGGLSAFTGWVSCSNFEKLQAWSREAFINVRVEFSISLYTFGYMRAARVLSGVVHIIAEPLTAPIMQGQADELVIDRRSVDLLTAVLVSTDWFEREIASEGALSDADAIQTGIVHGLEAQMPVCYPAWPDVGPPARS